MCLYPRLMDNPKYKKNKKNGGNVPIAKDNRVKLVPIGCGECLECCKMKRRNWQLRLLEDIKENKNAKFITLTFSNKSYNELAKEFPKCKGYNLDNAIVIRAVRLFLERWRKKYKKSLRHWLITEIGHKGTERIHLHGIVWTDEIKEIEVKWQYGYVWIGKKKNERVINYVNEKTINYITKYVTKRDFKHRFYRPIILTSAGIGRNYINSFNASRNKYIAGETKEYYKTRQGYKIGLPIYWRNKIYSEDEREKLWIEKIDKGVRYVVGEKVDNQDNYFGLLKYYRKVNERMGYGNGIRDWNLEEYENRLRVLKQNDIRIYKKVK